MSRIVVLLVVAGCRAELGGTDVDAPGNGLALDAPSAPSDAPAMDAGVDARPCAGGDAAAQAPDGSCFVHFFAPKSHADAKAECAALGGHLAYLKDAAAATFAESFIGVRDTWIGLTDLVTEMTFRWDDNTVASYTRWHAGEPNDGDDTYDEDCAIIAGTRVEKMWDDRPCAPTPQFPNAGLYAYLCQY